MTHQTELSPTTAKRLELGEANISQYQAIIFDCDGTLADSMPAHYLSWVATLEPYGIHLSEDRFYAMGGWPTAKVTAELAREQGISLDIDRVVLDKEHRFFDYIPAIQPIGPTVDIARQWHGKIPLAVATGGLPDVCARILAAIEIDQLFNTVVTCADVVRHKPDPDIFLEAANRLGVSPQKCLAFEDTEPGLIAATSAGMDVIDVRTYYCPRRIT